MTDIIEQIAIIFATSTPYQDYQNGEWRSDGVREEYMRRARQAADARSTRQVGEEVVTDTKDPLLMPFERFPDLAKWVERLANTPMQGIALRDWQYFLDALNAALSIPPVAPQPAAVAQHERGDDEPYDPSRYCKIDACRHEGCTRRADMCLSKYPTPPAPIAGPLTTEQLDRAQFGRSLHDRPAPVAAQQAHCVGADRALQLAAEYDAGTAKCIASGYMEFGPEFLADRKLVSAALRLHASAAPVADRDDEATKLLIEFQGMWSEPPLDSQQFEMLQSMIATGLMSPASFAEAADPDKGSVAAQHERGDSDAMSTGPMSEDDWKDQRIQSLEAYISQLKQEATAPVAGRAAVIEECAKMAETAMENAMSRGRAFDKRSRDHAKEVAREYVARSIAFSIRALADAKGSHWLDKHFCKTCAQQIMGRADAREALEKDLRKRRVVIPHADGGGK